jgi:glycine/D-amino acid oxidase-like deaminating enzyme
VGRPAPLLESLAPGLLLAGGHYRNGVLLAPATAEWVVQQLERPEPAASRQPGQQPP